MYRLHTVHTVHSMHFCYMKSLLLMIIQIKSILFNCGDSSVKVKVTVFERFIQLGKHVKIAINISITGDCF